MMGGDLVTLDDFSLKLITDKEMIACNQNGVIGSLVYEKDGTEVWNTPQKGTKHGWIGIFNRTDKPATITPASLNLGDNVSSGKLGNIWEGGYLESDQPKTIKPNGVLFLRY